MSDGNVAFKGGGGVLHIVLTAPLIWRICVLLTHLLFFWLVTIKYITGKRLLLSNNFRQVVHTLLPLSPSSIIWYQRKLGSKQTYRVVHQPVSRGFAVFADACLSGWLAEISADLRETVAH